MPVIAIGSSTTSRGFMDNNVYLIILLALAVPVGFVLGYIGRKFVQASKVNSAGARAETILQDAKAKAQEVLIEAREKSMKVIEEAKNDEVQRRKNVEEQQKRLEQRETKFDQKLLDLESKQNEVAERMKKIESVKEQILDLKQQHVDRLEQIAGLDRAAAREELLTAVEREMKTDLVARMEKLGDEMSEAMEQKARNVLSATIQRVTASHVAETTTTTVTLPNDEMKGRIIGKEGRNIRAIENLTGVELIVDDTPETIVISGFSPLRRHLAKRALDKLIFDGRIQPARIEVAVEEAKTELSKDIQKAGEDACYQLGVTGLHPKIVQLVGRLKYRTSYGQNVLIHSMEVGRLAGLLAAELGADVSVAKKGGLLHDIGKAVDHEIQGGHPEIGYDIMLKFGLPEEVAYMAIAHHEDKPKTLVGIICKVADQISGGRPGARKDSYEQYVQRLEELEGVATRFEGVEKAYAIQAGREVRVFVNPEDIDDLEAFKLAQNIARAIEQELKYPGEIKVNLLREKRVIEYAR